jgi:YD repeat-containing protein
MKKIFLLSLFLFSFKAGLGQTDLPTMIPPSPTAFQMTRYGDVAINESTGNINPSIPIHTYQAGRIIVPISMSFQGNGVKVDQAATWTGINWNLNAGGVITRVVRDEDDLLFSGLRDSYSYNDLYNYDTITQDSINELNSFIISPNIDSEADIFSFVFPGYSGSFYFDKNMEPQLTKNDSPLKIELDSTPPIDPISGIMQHWKREITITAPDGVKYYFGGLNASEANRSHRQSAGSEINQDKFAQTSFFLHKIQHPLGDEVYFDYTPYDYGIEISKSESYTKPVSKDLDCPFSDISHTLEDLKYDSFRLDSKPGGANGKVLSRIYSNKNSYEIVFDTNNASANVSMHYSKKLNDITIRKVANTSKIHKKISFDYIFPHLGGFNEDYAERFFLEKVKFLDTSLNNVYEYSMEYNHPEDLPERFSFSQDYLGYYSGITNTRYLPQVDHPAFSTINNTFANRSFDFEFASKGVLKMLNYPTKGSTVFEYETSMFRPENNFSTEEVRSNIYVNYTNNPPGGGGPDKNPFQINLGRPSLELVDLDGDVVDTDVVSNELINQTITINLENIISTEILDSHSKIGVTIYDETDGVYVATPSNNFASFPYNNNLPTRNDPYLGYVYLYPDMSINRLQLKEGHEYQVTVEIMPSSFSANATIYATVDFNYKVKSNELQEAGDIRVKRITNHLADHLDGINYSTEVKRYYYSDEDKLSPRYLSGSFYRDCCDSGNIGSQGQPLYNDYHLVTLSSNSLNNIFAVGSNSKMYREVNISFGGDSYENGGVKKEFIRNLDGSPFQFRFDSGNDLIVETSNRRENKSTLNGTLLKETFYKKKNESLLPIKEIENHYSTDRSTSFSNNITKVLYDECYNPYTTLEHLAIELYSTYSNKIQLDSTTTKVYDYSKIVLDSLDDHDGDGLIASEDPDDDNDGIPDWGDKDFDNDGIENDIDPDDDNDGILDVDEHQPKFFETKTQYEYDQYIGQPSAIITSSSENDISYTTKYIYPNINTDIVTYISQPTSVKKLKQEIGINEEQISLTTNLYSNYNNGINKKMLSQISSLKGNHNILLNLGEPRVTYHDYDNKGNPIEISKEDGIHIVYIWGYNKTQPIAKIVNATFSEVSQYTTNLQTLSNNDDDRTIGDLGYEGELRGALNNLRVNLLNAQVTTYTYDPLVGITSVTDPRGQTVYYEYDEFNRLKFVKDHEGNILSKNEYNYRQN